MWVLTLLAAWLVVGLLVGAFFAVLARGGRGTRRASVTPLPPPSPSLR